MENENLFTRTEMLLGAGATDKIKRANIAVFGVGGVGSYAVEALARSGVGALTLVDGDVYTPSNMNRQLFADLTTLGKNKAQVAASAVARINPDCKVTVEVKKYCADTAAQFDLSAFDYIVDAIDTVTDKVLLIKNAKAAGAPVISSMGAGNKLDPARFEVADIYSTSVCPLARIMRKLLKGEGIDSLKVVYSTEEPLIKPENGRLPGSVPFVPGVAGLIIAGEVVKDLIK